MQIHELNTRTPGVYDYAALDTGSQTYKAKVGDLKPQYVSYDSANPTSWADVETMGSNTPISTFFERVTYIARNVRYLWKLIGSNAFSNVAETISGAIGNTALGTDATTLSGAIAEHESDISTINGNLAELSGLKYRGVAIAAGRSKTFTFAAGGARYVLVINAAAIAARGVYLGSCTSAHVVSTTPVMNASDVTLSYGEDTLTVTAGNNSILADMYITSGNASVD